MKIQFNTDSEINGDERHQDFFTQQIEDSLDRFQTHISRIEVHLSDANGIKEGRNDIICVLEARLDGRKPMAVTHQAPNIELSVTGALNKLKAALETIIGRQRNY